MVKSRALRKLRSGDFIKVPTISRVTDPWLTEVVGRLGFDAIWLDMEHRPLGYDILNPISLACRATGIDLIVRILKTGYSTPMRVLESGANGSMVPHCRSVEEARQWVEWTRFAPLGRRGFDGAGADADYALADPLEHLAHANRETLLILQVEDWEAVECVEKIAAVEGVDLLLIGPADLTLSYGVPMQFEHPEVQKAIDRVVSAVAKAGKWWGIATATPQAAQRALDRGARMITCGGDHVFLVRGFQDAYEQFKDLRIH